MSDPAGVRREKDAAVTADPELFRVARREHQRMNVRMYRAADVSRGHADARAADGDLTAEKRARPIPSGIKRPAPHVDAIDVIGRYGDRHAISFLRPRKASWLANPT